MDIGNWAKRPGGKYHLIESVIDGDAVTRCGRRMDRVASRGELKISEVMPLTRMIGQPQLCKAGCDQFDAASRIDENNVPPTMDDDGSTHDESEPA